MVTQIATIKDFKCLPGELRYTIGLSAPMTIGGSVVSRNLVQLENLKTRDVKSLRHIEAASVAFKSADIDDEIANVFPEADTPAKRAVVRRTLKAFYSGTLDDVCGCHVSKNLDIDQKP